MNNIRAKIKRKLSLHDKNPDLDAEASDVDEETTGHLHREIEAAMADEEKHPQGKPGSFLNRLIMHGNKKTEEQMAHDATGAGKKA